MCHALSCRCTLVASLRWYGLSFPYNLEVECIGSHLLCLKDLKFGGRSSPVISEVTWSSSRLGIEMEKGCPACEKRKSSILSRTERISTATCFYDVYNYSQFPPEGLKSNCSILFSTSTISPPINSEFSY